MTAIEAIQCIMENDNFSLSELAEYSDCGSKSNIHHLLNLRQDLKVGTFVKLLEAMGYQLIIQSEDDEIVISYDL